MPIEIRELVIKAQVNQNRANNSQPQVNYQDLRALKTEVLDACRDIIEEIIEDKIHRR